MKHCSWILDDLEMMTLNYQNSDQASYQNTSIKYPNKLSEAVN